MKKPMIKNFVILVLVTTCTVLTIRLWFGDGLIQGFFLPSPVVVAADPLVHHPMARYMIEAAVVGVSADGDEYQTIYGIFDRNFTWDIITTVTTALISNGSFSHSGTLDDGVPPDFDASIVLQYNFAMPTGFFRENFGQRTGFLSSHFDSFDTLVISSVDDIMVFVFYSQGDEGYHTFVLDDEEVLQDFDLFFTQTLNSATSHEVFAVSPINELRLSTVEEFIRFFFPNPAAIVASTINNVYTYHDNFRVVKFHPGNIVEYSSLAGRSTGDTSFTLSFLASLEMIGRDRGAMAVLGAPMNDVVLTGYHQFDDQWIFYFDYIAAGVPAPLLQHHFLNHAIEVSVTDGQVVRYQRLLMQFIEVGE